MYEILKGEREERGLMAGTTMIINIIIIIIIINIIIVITEEKHKIYCSKGSQVVPACSSGKSRLEEKQSAVEMKQVR